MGTIILVIAGIVALVAGIIFLNYGFLWLRAWLCDVRVNIVELFVMQWFRKINPNSIVNALIMAAKAGIDLNIGDLQQHYMAGGDVNNVVRALIAADRANISLSFDKATAIDLAGRDVLNAVKISVTPKVIDCPMPSQSRKKFVEAVAEDGIQVLGRARVTVRADIEKLVGGATEETITARVGEGIVSCIGSAESHKEVLERPALISDTVEEKGLDTGTAFTILSIDIKDIDIGKNIGSRLQADQAEADMEVAQAKAEERRAMAVAHEQEMAAKVKENRSKVMNARAKVPRSIAEALDSEKLGIMDYYRLENIQADTSMRNSLSTENGEDSQQQEE